MNNHIVIIKLINGEDIIAVIVDETEQGIEVENPYFIKLDKIGAVITPYCIFTDDHNFLFKPESVISISKATDQLCEQYLNLNGNPYDSLNTVNDLEDLIDKITLTTSDISYDDEQTDLSDFNYLLGNNTKH